MYTWGTTVAERKLPFPCDRLLPEPDDALYRAVDVDAPVKTLFLWLCQLRVAPYSYDWLDNLGRRSPQRLTPGLEQLEAGQRFMRIFELAAFEPGKSITLQTGRGRFASAVVSYVAEARPAGGSRLLVKVSVQYSRGWIALPMRLGLAPGDLVMMRKQLGELKRLAESSGEDADRQAPKKRPTAPPG